MLSLPHHRTFLVRFGKFLPVAACLCLAILPIEKTHAWGIVGHRVVCELAFKQLTSDVQAHVNRLVQAFVKPNGKRFKDFSESCSFADTARHNARDGLQRWQHYDKFDHWHYLNVPRSVQKISESTINCREDCVVHAIEFHTSKLGDSALEEHSRGEALIFLAHWIADIHQPLHIGFADDHGGSDIDVTPAKRFGKNLHRAWDSGLIKRARGKRRVSQYISDIGNISDRDKVAWTHVQIPLAWAAESYLIATSKQVGYCRWGSSIERPSSSGPQTSMCLRPRRSVRIDKSYIANNTPLVETRLQQAAVRLAKQLDILLGHSKP